MPPMQVASGPQVPQSMVLPQLSTAVPQVQPRLLQVVVGVHGGSTGVPHWNGAFKPQNSPLWQPPLTEPQSIWFAAAVPQPS